MWSRIASFIVIILAVALVMGAPVMAADTVKIGALFSVTGPPSFLGEPERNTAQMMVETINQSGGVKGKKLELIVYDTQGDPTKTNQAASRLIKSDGVVTIIGPSTTGETMAIIPLVEKAQIPLISCAAGAKITEPVKKWVFKTAQNDSLAVEKIYQHLREKKLTKLAIITVSDSFGACGREQLKIHAPKYGMEIVIDDTFGPKDTDMTPQLTRIRGSKAQVIICWGTNPGPAVVARNVKQLNLTLPLYMSHGVSSKKFIELAGAASEGLILPSGKVLVAELIPDRDPQKKNLLAFRNAYQARYHTEGDHFGGHAWDAVMLLKTAMERVGFTPAAIRTGIEQTKNFSGIGGVFSFSPQDHAGLTADAFVLVQVKNGRWSLVK